ncbi:PQQ-binding-like beta-propeller repeat protein [Winogradskyella sp.]|uniref:outer membrane protein assembly factor BamB family protein n=1 Tax=Winogradskyella sp. TaxID=1883156 RepID=UPI003BAD5D3D
MNKKRNVLLILLLLISFGVGTYYILEFDDGEPNITQVEITNISELQIDSVFTKSIDFKSEVIQFNKDTTLKFQTNFKTGHVKQGSLKGYLTKNADGYTIKLKSKTPITTPTIRDDHLYVSGGFGSKSYFCFKVKDGSLVWALDLDDDGPSSAVISGSLLIFNTESCTIFAVDRFTGDLAWSYWLGDPLLSTPVVSENRVYTSYPSAKVYSDKTLTKNYKKIKPSHPFICLDATNGEIIWQKWLDGDVLKSPVIVNSNIYLTTFPGTLYKMDKTTGDILSCISLSATSQPSILNNRVLITKRSDDSTGIKESIAILDAPSLNFIKELEKTDAPYLDYSVQKKSKLKLESDSLDLGNGFFGGAPVTSGWELASLNIGQSNVASLQLFQPSLVAAHENNIICLMGDVIKCIDPLNENVHWSYKIDIDQAKEGGAVASTPIIVGDKLVTVTLKGKLIILDCKTGSVLFEKETKKTVRSSPVVKGGTVFIPTTTGELISINTNISGLDDYPMFMKNSEHNIN